jgi:hypothetical protein
MLYIGKPYWTTDNFLLSHLVARIRSIMNHKKEKAFHFLAFPLLSLYFTLSFQFPFLPYLFLVTKDTDKKNSKCCHVFFIQ